MCGVAGIVNLNGAPASLAVLRSMTAAVAHRGPDGEGFHVDGNVGLGHRRLSIIDLSPNGAQPMLSSDRNLALSYNGEIYNFEELRGELVALGHRFSSRTDSEVILNAWREWGEGSVLRFNGMFAFAILDRVRGAVYLVRDRYGIKPLYYARWNGVVAFGSEQKVLFSHPSAERKLNKAALAEYLTFQNIFTDQTLAEGVHLLPPATIMRIPLDGSTLSARRYWDYNFQEPEGAVDVEAYREELSRLINNAVRRQLVADVELGSYLSGGLDSGTLTAIASGQLPYIKTFTCGFDLSSASGMELAFDERTKAEAMSARFQTEHYEMVLKAGDMERAMTNLMWHLEEPRVGQSYPNYYAAKLASRFVKVVLSGTGGDELFAGYPWRYFRATPSRDFGDFVERYYNYWQRMLTPAELKALLAPIWPEVKDVSTQAIFSGVFADYHQKVDRPEDYVNHCLYFEAKTFLHGLLVVEDKLSMAHGLEARVPFLDNDLVDFAMSCPVQLKLNNLGPLVQPNENQVLGADGKFAAKQTDGKQILRDAMRDVVTVDVADGPKQGFSAPDGSWFRGQSMQYVERQLMSSESPMFEWIDRASVRRLVDDHLSGRQNRRLLIWSLLSLREDAETWR